MNRLKFIDEEGLSLTQKILLTLFVALYPIFLSMHTMLPPFIGLAGYFLLINIEQEKVYVIAPLLYLINLDFNLSLPLFFSILVIILIYFFIYTPLKRLVRCKVCLLFMLIITIDFIYYMGLFVYDFMFNTSTVLADMMLIYFMVFDILMGLLL